MKNKIPLLYGPINAAFLISVLYWIYLALTSKPVICFDAAGYELVGKIIAEQGWLEFFKTGPHREPFYPALIAFSMHAGKALGVSYQFIQILLQLLILFLTQILTLRILCLLRINNLLSAAAILYLGISPAIVNSALSLYSEIATYPVILASMLLIHRSWISFAGPRIRIISLAVGTSLLFVIMVLSKQIFELVTPVFLFLLLISALSTRHRKFVVNTLIYLVVFFSIFYLLVAGYKSANKIFNGRFTITGRSAGLLYGCTARRMEPLTRERFLTALAYVPGEGVCQSIFGEEKCRFWSFLKVEELGYQKLGALSNMPPKAVDNTLVALSMQKVLQNPAQYILLTVIEGSKMLFWESTQIGYVTYPAGLTKLFAWTPFKNGLRLGMALLTLFAFAYLAALLWRGRKNILAAEEEFLFPYLLLLFIFSFVSFYAILLVLPRYAFPIVPLYLIVIAYVFQKICFRWLLVTKK